MFIQTKRSGEAKFLVDDHIIRGGNGCYYRRIIAITDFEVPYRNKLGRVVEGTEGGLLECSSDGETIYPIVSKDSWLDYDSIALAGALVEKSFIQNSIIGCAKEGGEYFYSNSYYRKSICLNSVVVKSTLFGQTVIDEFLVDGKPQYKS
jgi:hypothetical protein